MAQKSDSAVKELIVLWLSLAALVCAVLRLNNSLKQLVKEKQGNVED